MAREELVLTANMYRIFLGGGRGKEGNGKILELNSGDGCTT